METGIPMTAQTKSEQEVLVDLLHRTEALFLLALENISADQACFKTAPDRWSIAGIAEHVVSVEEFLLLLLSSAEPSTQEIDHKMDERIHRWAANRTRVVPAPEGVHPCGRFADLADSAAHFREVRQKTHRYVQQTAANVRGLRVQHPVAGNIDAYQCLLLLAYHPQRHIGQIEEIKSRPDFPDG
jgi:DinB family protein